MQQSPSQTHAATSLELRSVGDICGHFFVASYQRGYRWVDLQVNQILDDIWTNGANPYSLQPIVVKRRSDRSWELIDGQQRLTTLYLISLYMQRAGLHTDPPRYSITYETRAHSAAYLTSPNESQADDNIDFHHIYRAYKTIQHWFESRSDSKQSTADTLRTYLSKHVRVIWYETPPQTDAITLFTRLNVGRIHLTDAELFKALLLSQVRKDPQHKHRAYEWAAQWDLIERDLHNPKLWAFISPINSHPYQTRITLLLDILADELTNTPPQHKHRQPFFTFNTLREAIPKTSLIDLWNQILDLHALIQGWYHELAMYHKIGFLTTTGTNLRDIISTARTQTKSQHIKHLNHRIQKTLNLTPSEFKDISYTTQRGQEDAKNVLLLMNIEATYTSQTHQALHLDQRFPFDLYRRTPWSLEHIHAQNAEGLNTANQWITWLTLHRDALSKLPDNPTTYNPLLQRIQSVLDNAERITKNIFERLATDIQEIFTSDDTAQSNIHSISNLALMDRNTNSALSNSVFAVKRSKILTLDRNGTYIPICTRRVFLKYYTNADTQQLHFWSDTDHEHYLDAMIHPETGILTPYLLPETPHTDP